ncbi:MAG: hypothetical protein D6766_00910 [Verrucomicrobia bacterium]|nr:MAG: hypothetical protein D6766_00910 [Verrucomicrobiota bacterium]
MQRRVTTWLRVIPALAAVEAVPKAWGCATCFGASDAPMAKGLNVGILFLLGVVGFVLSGLVAFFVMLGKRSAAASRAREAVAHAAARHENRPTGFVCPQATTPGQPGTDGANDG